MNKTRLHAIVVLLTIALVIPVAAIAQATFGNITGTVTDQSGAAVPNIAVTIRDTERGATYDTKANGDELDQLASKEFPDASMSKKIVAAIQAATARLVSRK